MSPVMNPQRGRVYRRLGYRAGAMRVSDTERAEAADSLSKHYGDGRLDEATFNERLEAAMNATTQADLDGLLGDLPPAGPPGRAPRRPPHHSAHRILFLFLIVLLVVAAGSAMARFLAIVGFLAIPWLLIGLVAFAWARHRRRITAGPPDGPGR